MARKTYTQLTQAGVVNFQPWRGLWGAVLAPPRLRDAAMSARGLSDADDVHLRAHVGRIHHRERDRGVVLQRYKITSVQREDHFATGLSRRGLDRNDGSRIGHAVHLDRDRRASAGGHIDVVADAICPRRVDDKDRAYGRMDRA